MVDTNEIMAYMGRRNYTKTRLAKEMRVTHPTMRRMLSGKISLDEAERLSRILCIPPEEKARIFFAEKVS